MGEIETKDDVGADCGASCVSAFRCQRPLEHDSAHIDDVRRCVRTYWGNAIIIRGANVPSRTAAVQSSTWKAGAPSPRAGRAPLQPNNFRDHGWKHRRCDDLLSATLHCQHSNNARPMLTCGSAMRGSAQPQNCVLGFVAISWWYNRDSLERQSPTKLCGDIVKWPRKNCTDRCQLLEAQIQRSFNTSDVPGAVSPHPTACAISH